MEVNAINVSDTVDIYLSDNDDDEYQIWQDEGQQHASKHDRMDATVKNFASRFKGKLTLSEKSANLNPLLPLPIEEEGKRDRNSMKLEKYFGDRSRLDFFGRTNWVRDKRYIMNRGDNVANKVVMTPKEDYAVDFAFAPRRFDDFDNLEDDCNEEEEHEDAEENAEDDITMLMRGGHLDAQTTYATVPTNMAATVSSVSTIASESTLHTSCSAIERGAPTSPRTRYIGNCINKSVNPRASLIVRKRVSTELSLRHQGMGDKMAEIFAESLKELPFVHTLDLTDNNLTDVGLRPIINAVISLSNLTDLNLSQNIVDGESSKALAVYLSTPECALKRLILQSADVDDSECQMFVASLMASNNQSLKELDLSKNIIGKSENLNTVMPDLITGGEAIAELLCANTCHLETLGLAWNMIRLDGAIELAQSLAATQYLTYLDLSYNALGKEAGEMLGKSLITNEKLEYLDISNNNINSTACFTICAGLEENTSLRTLVMDGNPIGELGFTLTSQIPIVIGGRIRVTTEKCNKRIKDTEDHKIDINNIADRYSLDMSRPFERAILFKILNVASLNRSLSLENCIVTHPCGKEHHVKFKWIPSDRKYNSLSKKMKAEVDNLRHIEDIASNEELAELLFLEYDEDGSGGLDVDEVESLIGSLGLSISRDMIEIEMRKFDLDGGGVLELAEFLEFFRDQKLDATSRIRELTKSFTITTTKHPKTRFIPPLKGTVSLLVSDIYMSKGATVVSSENHAHVMDIAKNATEGQTQILEYGFKGAKLRSKEAFAVYHFMLPEVRSPALALEKLLPNMINYVEARLLIEQTIQNDKAIMKRLRQTMGGCLNAILGHFNGWYSLDLSVSYDRICLGKLLEQNQNSMATKIENSCFERGITGDVSQLGDWSSFRNVMVDGQPGIITSEMFNPMAKKGTLHFDFSGSDKPDEKSSIISDQRVINCLILHGIITVAGKPHTLMSMNKMKAECAKNYRSDGVYHNNLNESRAKQVQMCMLHFYANLHKRPALVRRGQLLEENKQAEYSNVNVSRISSLSSLSWMETQISSLLLLEVFSALLHLSSQSITLHHFNSRVCEILKYSSLSSPTSRVCKN